MCLNNEGKTLERKTRWWFELVCHAAAVLTFATHVHVREREVEIHLEQARKKLFPLFTDAIQSQWKFHFRVSLLMLDSQLSSPSNSPHSLYICYLDFNFNKSNKAIDPRLTTYILWTFLWIYRERGAGNNNNETVKNIKIDSQQRDSILPSTEAPLWVLAEEHEQENFFFPFWVKTLSTHILHESCMFEWCTQSSQWRHDETESHYFRKAFYLLDFR